MKVKFWTPEEDSIVKNALEKFESGLSAAKWAAPKLGRTVASVQLRTSRIARGMDISYRTARVKKTVVKKENVNKGVNIPKGFTFDIQPKRAVMYTDHVRLYF
jgi:hypothetical protein